MLLHSVGGVVVVGGDDDDDDADGDAAAAADVAPDVVGCMVKHNKRTLTNSRVLSSIQ